MSLTDFASDSHAAKYQGELDAHPDAFGRLVELLNDPANEQRLVDAELHGMPALSGVVRYVESDAEIAKVLQSGPRSNRFRQTVGVTIKLKMARLGWTTTGRKGTVKGARHFTKAEHYEPRHEVASHDAGRALAALDAVERIGDDDERGETGRYLIDALAATRASEGRVF
jgi:hypothetical protein